MRPVIQSAGSSLLHLCSANSVAAKNPVPREALAERRFLGNLSYLLYLNHYSLGIVLSYQLRDIDPTLVRFAACLVGVFVASVAVYHYERFIWL